MQGTLAINLVEGITGINQQNSISGITGKNVSHDIDDSLHPGNMASTNL